MHKNLIINKLVNNKYLEGIDQSEFKTFIAFLNKFFNIE